MRCEFFPGLILLVSFGSLTIQDVLAMRVGVPKHNLSCAQVFLFLLFYKHLHYAWDYLDLNSGRNLELSHYGGLKIAG